MRAKLREMIEPQDGPAAFWRRMFVFMAALAVVNLIGAAVLALELCK